MIVVQVIMRDAMRTQRPRIFLERLKVTGALMIALGIPMLLFLGLSVLPVFVRGNQDLYDAIEQRDLHRVQGLLRQGADANSTSRGFQILSARDQDRRRRFDEPPLIRAIQLDHPEIAAALLNKGADVNARDAAGTPALMLAVQQGQPDLVKLLLDGGADVHATDRRGNTVLRYDANAERRGPVLRPDIRELLLKAGARE
jgi:ankyrin repeat protein